MTTETIDPCLSRHGGNAQSNEAWNHVDAKGDREKIMAFYADGSRYTAKEIAALMGKPFNAISGRFASLKGGKLRKTGVVRDGSAELESTEVSQ